MDMDKYDVFISCKSEDYQYAEEVYDFLVSEGIKTFLASKELRELGESDYRDAIEEAMDETTHIIVFASNAEYVRSKWIKYEWGLFVNDKISDIKQGNIVTILKDVSIRDLPIGLRKYQSFPFDKYKEDILKYVETDASKVRKEQILKQKEAERLKLQQQKEREEKKKELKEELIKTSEAYKRNLSSLQFEVNKIYGLLQDLDIKERECPICNQMLPIKETSCQTCGWILSPLDGVKELAYLNKDNEELREAYKNHYNEFLHLKNEGTDKKELEALKDLKAQLEFDLQASKKESHAIKEENIKLVQELKVREEAKARLVQELRDNDAEKTQLKKRLELANVDYQKLQEEGLELKKSYVKAQNKVGELEYKISQLNKDLDNYRKILEENSRKVALDKESNKESDSQNSIPESLTFNINGQPIVLKLVRSERGDFFITYSEIPGNLCNDYPSNFFNFLRGGNPSSGNRQSGELFEKVLDNFKVKTGYRWDFPTPQEWIEAYNEKAFVRRNPDVKEWCRDRKGNFIS